MENSLKWFNNETHEKKRSMMINANEKISGNENHKTETSINRHTSARINTRIRDKKKVND